MDREEYKTIGLDDEEDDLFPINNSIGLDDEDDDDLETNISNNVNPQINKVLETINLSFQSLANDFQDVQLEEDDDNDLTDQLIEDKDMERSELLHFLKESNVISSEDEKSSLESLDKNALIAVENNYLDKIKSNDLVSIKEDIERVSSDVKQMLVPIDEKNQLNLFDISDMSKLHARDVITYSGLIKSNNPDKPLSGEECYEILKTSNAFTEELANDSVKCTKVIEFMKNYSESWSKVKQEELQKFTENKNMINKYSKYLYEKLPTYRLLKENGLTINDLVYTPNVDIVNDGYAVTCGNCGNVTHTEYPLFAIVYVNVIVPITNPCRCDKCGKYNMVKSYLVQDIADRMKKSILSEVNKANKENKKVKTSEFIPDSHTLIIPPVSLLCDTKYSIFNDKRVYFIYDKKLECDWDKLSRDHMKMIETFYRKSKVDKMYDIENVSKDTKSLGIKGIAKIVAGSTTGYGVLKEKSISGLLHFFNRFSFLGLSSIDVNGKSFLARKYRGREREFYRELSGLIKSDKFIDKEGNLINIEEFLEKVDTVLDSYDNLQERRDNIISLINKYKHIFVRIPLSENVIQEDALEDLCSYEPLRDLIDELSDYMIIYNSCYVFMESFYPHKLETNDKDNSYFKRLSNLFSASDLDSFKNANSELVSFFMNRLNNIVSKSKSKFMSGFIFVSNYYSNFIISSDLAKSISALAENMCNGKFYSAVKIKLDIENSLESLNVDYAPEELKDIFNLIKNIPIDRYDMSEFDFYFGDSEINIDLSEKDKLFLLEMYSKKRFIPKTFKGISFNEICNEYDNTDSIGEISNSLDSYENYLKDNFVLFEGLRNFSYYRHIMSVNTTFYDLLRGLALLDVEEFCELFEYNKDLTELFLAEDYNIPKIDFDKGKLIRFILFKNSDMYNIIQKDEKESDDILRLDLDQFKEEIKFELENDEECLSIAKEFFGDENL